MGVCRGGVIVVDDDQLVLRAFALGFGRCGVAVKAASTLEGGLDLARTTPFELAIVDLQLGGESGLGLLREMRTRQPTARLVLVTGYGSVEVAVQAMKAGADEVLEKPITPQEILARVHRTTTFVVETPSIDRAMWEHVSRVLADCNNNKSEAARRLRKPRSWLRRFLDRPAPRA